jgi:Xaa-Pro aminopeptidase
VTAFADRAARAVELARSRELDMLLVTNLVNVRYLSGFTGTNGVCLLGPDRRIFITDFRYVERARTEVPDYEQVRGKRDLLESVGELVQKPNGEAVRLGFEDSHMTVRQNGRLRTLLDGRAELVPAGGLVEELRMVKDDEELATIRAAASLGDDLYRWLIEDFGLRGRTEQEVGRALERRAQDIGADGPAFPVIVAAAENGGVPHAAPRDVTIPDRTLVVIDLGTNLAGYCSDCTRTFATGDLDGEATEVYELVRAAQADASTRVSPGVPFSAVDAVAREAIQQAGRGEQFGHPIGHGVGLEVHEEPRLAPDSKGDLAPGQVVTVEPGVYVPGRFGVRIEDLVVVTRDGREVLTSTPRELITV